jgi:hypothetical protein
LDLLLEAAVSDFSFSVRRGAARGLGNIIWSDLEESRVSEAQKAVFAALEQLSQGIPEWVVRYAAIVGLEGLATAAAAFRWGDSRTFRTDSGDRSGNSGKIARQSSPGSLKISLSQK